MKLKVQRKFTRPSQNSQQNVYSTCSWESFAYQGRQIEVPTHWSETAREIVCRQYLRKFENSVRDLIFRMAHTLRLAGEWQNYFADQDSAQSFEDELAYILLHQLGSLNSPVWFNLGIFPAYGVLGQSQNFVWEKDQGVTAISSAYVRPQVSACFIQSIEDNLISIYDLLKSEAKLFKFGSGSGTNFSNLRGSDEPLEFGGTSSGLMSYLEIFDKSAQAIKSGGTTRRAAKMVCLDADHPEIEKFVDWKLVEERKARVLSAAGFGVGFESEAYRSVSGQNSNNSIRVSDDFLHRVSDKKKWPLKARVSGQTIAEVEAEGLWKKMARAAWECADPGLQFHDTINKWHTCPAGGEIRGSNPCSEYMFLDDSACNLASLNLVRFLKEDSHSVQIDWESFSHVGRLLFLAQDILIDYASYPTAKICENSHQYRPLGLGYANLGGLIMRCGIPYDSEKAQLLCSQVTGALHAVALSASVELAGAMGSFAEFSKNKKSVLKVVQQHQQAWLEVRAKEQATLLKGAELGWVDQIYSQILAQIEAKGLRNAQHTLLAPTGTIGLLMDCDTLGIEPEFALVKRKTLAGGGELKIVNHSVGPALQRLGYSAQQMVEILNFARAENSLLNAPGLKSEHISVFDCALPPKGAPDRRVSPLGHIGMMAAAQPFLSGAISKTVNLPASITVEEVEKIFMMAWKMGLKSIAIYRDSSKSAQPLCVDC